MALFNVSRPACSVAPDLTNLLTAAIAACPVTNRDDTRGIPDRRRDNRQIGRGRLPSVNPVTINCR
jgi:mRNA-degrading endonuclease toxin of MazEF toxin-antitoxin module